MSHQMLQAPDATLRHPVEAAQILKKINAARRRKDKSAPALDASGVAWKYETALAVSGPGARRTPALRGRSRLELLKDRLIIELVGTHARHGSRVVLDNATLLAGPDDGLPVEVLGGPAPQPEPASRSRLWLWQPMNEDAPGWCAHVLVAARPAPVPSHPDGLFLDLARGDSTRSVWFDGVQGFHAIGTEAHAAAFKANAHSRRAGPVADVDIDGLVAAHAGPGGRWMGVLVEQTIAELLKQLDGPGFMVLQMGAAPMCPDPGPSPPQPGPAARFFDTHEGLSGEDIMALASLDVPDGGCFPASRLPFFMASREICRHESGEMERSVALAAVANGEAVGDAVARGQAAIERRRAGAVPHSPRGLRP